MVHRLVIGLTVLWIGLPVVMLAGGCRPSSPPSAPTTATAESFSVELTIDSGSGGERKSWQLHVPPAATVLDCLRVAHRDHGLELSVRGEGSSAFLQSLGGVSNGGGTTDNWIFRVDGRLGTASCGVVPVHPGARIEWVRGAYQPE